MKRKVLTDKHGRMINYLRLSVTDRCNFRCYYCMPEEGIDFASGKDLLSFSEMLFLCQVFCNLGVSKIRITGGEPFARAGVMPFLSDLSSVPGLDQITATTNGTFSTKYISQLKKAGIRKVNVSIDSLNPARFFMITRRDAFDSVYSCIFLLLREGFDVKLNCVVSATRNTDDIIPFIELTRKYPLRVRFLEEMPFNGSGNFDALNWTYKDIYEYIAGIYPEVETTGSDPNGTSVNYRIPGFKGSFGIIPSFSRTFCGTCNRIRLSATGELRTCLYGPPACNLRDVLRAGASAHDIERLIEHAVSGRLKNGFEAENSNRHTLHNSMSVLGG